MLNLKNKKIIRNFSHNRNAFNLLLVQKGFISLSIKVTLDKHEYVQTPEYVEGQVVVFFMHDCLSCAAAGVAVMLQIMC